MRRETRKPYLGISVAVAVLNDRASVCGGPPSTHGAGCAQLLAPNRLRLQFLPHVTTRNSHRSGELLN